MVAVSCRERERCREPKIFFREQRLEYRLNKMLRDDAMAQRPSRGECVAFLIQQRAGIRVGGNIMGRCVEK